MGCDRVAPFILLLHTIHAVYVFIYYLLLFCFRCSFFHFLSLRLSAYVVTGKQMILPSLHSFFLHVSLYSLPCLGVMVCNKYTAHKIPFTSTPSTVQTLDTIAPTESIL